MTKNASSNDFPFLHRCPLVTGPKQICSNFLQKLFMRRERKKIFANMRDKKGSAREAGIEKVNLNLSLRTRRFFREFLMLKGHTSVRHRYV